VSPGDNGATTAGACVVVCTRTRDRRLVAYERLGIEPKVVNLDPSQDAVQVARALNVLRTHYTPSQRAIFAAARANATQGDGRWKSQLRHPEVVTMAEAAKEVGLSRSAVARAKRLAREAAPEVVNAVKAGKLTLHAAGQMAGGRARSGFRGTADNAPRRLRAGLQTDGQRPR